MDDNERSAYSRSKSTRRGFTYSTSWQSLSGGESSCDASRAQSRTQSRESSLQATPRRESSLQATPRANRGGAGTCHEV
eukprot:6147579-Prymnesium_polylepis.1